MLSSRLRAFTISAVIAASCNACAPEIGDDCETSLDCSAQGSRACDRTQPEGYCTIAGCEAKTCPEEAVCVKFRPQTERLAVTFCMLQCSSNSDCRQGDGYRCLTDREFGNGEDAELLDRGNKRFCAIPSMTPMSGDAEDAGVRDGG